MSYSNPDPPAVRNALKVLVPGSALMLLMLVAAGYVGISALQFNEQSTARQVLEQEAITRLVDDIQREEDSLNDIFYDMASGVGAAEKRALIEQLSAVTDQVRRTTEAGMSISDPARWLEIRKQADAFLAEVRRSAGPDNRPFAPSTEFFRQHAALMSALSDLVAASYHDATEAEAQTHLRSRERLKQALVLLGIAFLLGIAVAVLTVWLTSKLIRRMEWQTDQLVRLSEQILGDQESTARRFSRELHDEFGQTLSAIEASLIAMRKQGPDLEARLEDCLALVKEGISNVRELSQLLRPSILDDFGLGPSLQRMAEGFSQRTGIQVEYQGEIHDRVASDTETHVFRIAQEALTNIARHSGATEARLKLAVQDGMLLLTIADNGSGLVDNEKRQGLGLLGMRARARSAGGSCTIESHAGKGVIVRVQAPMRPRVDDQENSHTAG
jgi:signal transduction histidine kinase